MGNLGKQRGGQPGTRRLSVLTGPWTPPSPLAMRRIAHGVPQRVVAKAVGVSQPIVSELEAGLRMMSPAFERVAAYYGVSARHLRAEMSKWLATVARLHAEAEAEAKPEKATRKEQQSAAAG